MLGFIVLGAVLVVTLLFALAAYLIDRGEARLEESDPRGFDAAARREERLGAGFEK